MICADELMSVMVSLGNPRTMKEIKVHRHCRHQAVVTRLYIPDTQEMIAEEDNDGDGVITKEEFTKMLQKKNNSK